MLRMYIVQSRRHYTLSEINLIIFFTSFHFVGILAMSRISFSAKRKTLYIYQIYYYLKHPNMDQDNAKGQS